MKTVKSTIHQGKPIQLRMVENSESPFKSYLIVFLISAALLSGCKKTIISEGGGTGDITNAPSKILTAGSASFSIAILPDPQYYTGCMDTIGKYLHGNEQMWESQIDWIISHKTSANIAYVAGLGDITDGGDDATNYHQLTQEWINATYIHNLETAQIPYGTAVGNHEELQYIGGKAVMEPTNPKTHFNLTANFGYAHFAPGHLHTGGAGGAIDPIHFYGGSCDDSGNLNLTNNNHYDVFSAGGLKFIVIYIEYDDEVNPILSPNVYAWADNLLGQYSTYKAIIVTHMAGHPGIPDHVPALQGQKIITTLRSHRNLFMILGGHVQGEGARQDTYQGRNIKTFISDYQDYKDSNGVPDGGAGYMRLMTISVDSDYVHVSSFSPYIRNNTAPLVNSPSDLTDANSLFTVPLFHEVTASRMDDFTKDGKSDLALFNNGVWKVKSLPNTSTPIITTYSHGSVPVPADFNGDGTAEYTCWDPASGNWFIYPSATANSTWGVSTDIPVPADYDGDGKADIAVYRPSNKEWYLQYVGSGLSIPGGFTGATGDIPVPADYDGDGKVDFAVFRPGVTAKFFDMQYPTGVNWGTTGDIPVPGDYFGNGTNGLSNFAVFRPSNGGWYIYGEPQNLGSVLPSPLLPDPSQDIPAPGDYDGLGRTQPAVYRPSTHTLYIGQWTDYPTWAITSYEQVTFGATGDKLLNLPYAIRKFFFP